MVLWSIHILLSTLLPAKSFLNVLTQDIDFFKAFDSVNHNVFILKYFLLNYSRFNDHIFCHYFSTFNTWSFSRLCTGHLPWPSPFPHQPLIYTDEPILFSVLPVRRRMLHKHTLLQLSSSLEMLKKIVASELHFFFFFSYLKFDILAHWC